MSYEDSLTPRDLADKGLEVLRVECEACGRSGRYRVTTLAKTIGWDGKLTDWLYDLTPTRKRHRLQPVALNDGEFEVAVKQGNRDRFPHGL